MMFPGGLQPAFMLPHGRQWDYFRPTHVVVSLQRLIWNRITEETREKFVCTTTFVVEAKLGFEFADELKRKQTHFIKELTERHRDTWAVVSLASALVESEDFS